MCTCLISPVLNRYYRICLYRAETICLTAALLIPYLLHWFAAKTRAASWFNQRCSYWWLWIWARGQWWQYKLTHCADQQEYCYPISFFYQENKKNWPLHSWSCSCWAFCTLWFQCSMCTTVKKYGQLTWHHWHLCLVVRWPLQKYVIDWCVSEHPHKSNLTRLAYPCKPVSLRNKILGLAKKVFYSSRKIKMHLLCEWFIAALDSNSSKSNKLLFKQHDLDMYSMCLFGFTGEGGMMSTI